MVRPRIRLLPQSQLNQDSAHSLLISLLRGLAAVEVAAGHLRNETFPGLSEVAAPTLGYQLLALATGFAHQAVIVFFVISGWLVGGSLLNRHTAPDALAHYAIDRITRLWTVLLPTFVLMVVFGLATGELRPGPLDLSAANDYSLVTLLGNLLGLQTVVLEPFGGNYPLWSLANESWYYLMFPLFLACAGGSRGWRRAASGLALLATALLLPYVITLYFFVWMLGAIFSRIKIDGGAGLRLFFLCAALGSAGWARLYGGNDDISQATFVQDLVFGLACLLFLSSMQIPVAPTSWPQQRARAVAQFLAEFSFTLYVLHVPLIKLMRHALLTLAGTGQLVPGRPSHYLLYAGMLGVLLAASYLSYLAFEARTPAVRRWLKAMLQAGPARALDRPDAA